MDKQSTLATDSMKKKKALQKYGARKSLILFALVTAIPIFQGSCVRDSTRSIAPGYSSSKIKNSRSFYVRKDEEDDDNLGQDIVDELTSRGYRATVGTSQKSPSKTDATISYNDKWAWDVTMYMLNLELQAREPGTDAIFATARTTRTSLVRKSQREMVRETVGKLIEN